MNNNRGALISLAARNFCWLLLIVALLTANALRQAQAAPACAIPGADGSATPTGIVNSYYPGNGTAFSGSTSIPVGAIDTSSGGSAKSIAAGDLLLVIQIQDAAISTSNSSAYGGSGNGQGYTFLGSTGLYEYTVAAGPVSGGAVALAAPLVNSYTQASANSIQGQRSYQVIRVPQYSSATLGAGLTAAAWNGRTGGVVAFDVAGTLNWSGQTIDVTGRGFRGAAGRQLSGATGFANTDYATPASSTTNGGKGEGIAGTPQFLFLPATVGAATNGNGSVLDNGVEGYPNGSYGRGAPGNAGGGGTDGNPSANDQNTGGAGGGSYGIGGTGGFGWTPGTPPGSQTGGIGGAGVPMSVSRLTLGGGGGAGTTNNGTGTPGSGLASSGAAGGGIVMIRALTMTGGATIAANGANGNPSVLNDASGGGGGGGAVLVVATGGGGIGALTVNVNGGNGGSNTGSASGTCPVGTNNCPHGPGGGGGGGFAVLSGSATVNANGGAMGTTAASPTTTVEYGATSAPGGFQIFNVTPSQVPGTPPTDACFPLLSVVKTTATPSATRASTATYTISVTNQNGKGTAQNVTLSDVLPNNPNFTFAANITIALSGGATRVSVADPPVAATNPSWGSFTIPGGGSVSVSFNVNIAAATPLATYQNPATVTYLDPTRTSASQTVTPGGTYTTGGSVAGTNYNPASSPNEDVTVRQAVVITKAFTPVNIAANETSQFTITLTNPNAVALTGAALADAYPAGLRNAASPGATTTCAGGTVAAASNGNSVVLNNAIIPANGSCTLSVSVTSAVAQTYVNTIAAGALTTAQNVTNVAAAIGTLRGSPSLTKSFSVTAASTNQNVTLKFDIANPNPIALTNIQFTDAFPANLVAVGSAVSVTGTGCAGFLPATIAANATSFNLSAGTLPANSVCSVSFPVKASVVGNYANTASGVSSSETPNPGPPSNAAFLGVQDMGIAKAFSPAQIAVAGTSTLTFTLTNPTSTAQTNGRFTDVLSNMSVASSTLGGTCTGTTHTPALTVGATNLNFSGINIPANASCTVSVQVTSSTAGALTNTTSGVSTTLMSAGPQSNTAILNVLAKPTIAKLFTPGTIQAGATSTLTFTLTNSGPVALSNGSFTDTLTNMQIANNQTVGGNCTGVTPATLAGGVTSLSFSGINIPANANCTISVVVTSNSASPAAGYPNTASGVATAETGAAGAGSNTANLLVLGAPAISKGFSPAQISPGATSTLTFTLTNTNSLTLSNANFTDVLAGMSIASTAIGGTCAGTTSSPALAIGASALNLTVPNLPAGSCTVTVQVTSNVAGANPNTASGIVTAQTPSPGVPSNTAVLTILSAPMIGKAFSPGTISVGGTTTMTFSLVNPNASALTNVKFTDTLVNMRVASTAIGGTCAGTTNTPALAVGAANLSLTVPSLPAAGCTVTIQITSSAISPAAGHANATSGATSTETPAAGLPSETAYLHVLATPTITKNFTPDAIAPNATSTLIFTLSNPNPVPLSGASFSDPFPANLTTTSAAQTYTGAGRGTCTGTIPNSGSGTLTSVSFAGINIPAGGSCTVMVDVTSGTSGNYTNVTSGITTAQTATAGAASNTATLAVGRIGIDKSFSPGTIAAGATSTITFAIQNGSGSQRTGAAFSDTLTNMQIAATGPAGGTCVATSPNNFTAGATVLNFANLTIPVAGCTVTVVVTSNTASSASGHPNTTSGVSVSGLATGPPSNTANLIVVAKPTLVKSFNPTSISLNDIATLSFTLNNPNSTTLANAQFNDAFPAGMSVASTTLGGTCTGIASTPALSAGATSLNLSVPNLLPGSCTIDVQVTVTTTGLKANTASGITTAQTALGAASNTATLTVTADAPAITTAFTPASIGAGGTSQMVFTLTNPNSAPLTGASFSDALTNMQILAAGAAGGTCTGASTNSFTAGQTGTINFGGLTIPAAASCTVTVNVSSASVGVNPNTASGVTSTESGAAGPASNTANLTVTVQSPAIAKAFGTSPISVGGTSLITFTLTNPNAVPLTNVNFTDTLNNMSVASASIGGTCAGTTNSPALGIGATSLNLTVSTLPVSACTITVLVTSSAIGTNPNTTSGATSTQTAAPGPVSNTANLVVSAGSVTLSGFVYSDVNHNASLDGGEGGSGQTLYAKLIQSSSVQQVVAVNAGTGFYSFGNVLPGTYTIVVSTNNSTSVTSSSAPPGWLGTEAPSQTRSGVAVGGVNVTNQNFGLFNGSKLSGSVFADTGSPSGTANDGVRNGTETGIPRTSVRATSPLCPGTICDSVLSDGAGNYTLWIPASVGASSIDVIESNPGGMISTGAQIGNTGGSYNRTSDTLTFSNVLGTIYSGVNFGDVPDNAFLTDGAQVAAPGTAVIYSHRFTAGSAGTLSFTTAATAAAWSNVIYRDANCNAALDAGEGVTVFSTISVVADQTVCILIKEFVPANAPSGAQDKITVTATLLFTNAAPALSVTYSHTDTTTVGAPSAQGLQLVKSVDKATAQPNEVLTYTITYNNNGTGAITNLIINDTTPAYTTYIGGSAGCPVLNVRSTCTVSTEPANGGAGTLSWTITGSIAPGGSSTVQYQVRISQ